MRELSCQTAKRAPSKGVCRLLSSYSVYTELLIPQEVVATGNPTTSNRGLGTHR